MTTHKLFDSIEQFVVPHKTFCFTVSYNMYVWIARDIEKPVRLAASQRPVIVLTGARQTGKSSLLRNIFPDCPYVSLDLPSEADLAGNDPAAFLKSYSRPLLIDEVQYAPKVFRYLKSEVDKNRSKSGQFILTGSQKFSLMHEISDSLAGRAEILELEPLSVEEISRSMPQFKNDQLMLRGGYPELYQNPDLDSFTFYRSYVATYLERDVRTLLNVTSLRDFERMIRVCALRSGQLLNKAEMARDVGISPSTANEWLSVLETSGLVVLLQPWFSNKTRSMVKSPKLYMADTGLLTTLLNIQTADEMFRSPHIGAIWETFVLAEMRKRETARRGRWSISFWTDRKSEVDFVIDRGGRLELYDAKWTERPSTGDLSGILHARETIGAKLIDKQAIVCRTPKSYPVTDSTRALTLRDL